MVHVQAIQPNSRVLSTNPSAGARLVTADGQALPLRSTALSVEARGGLARVILEQHFYNPRAQPLLVTYLLPLPADGAVSGFSFTLKDRKIVGEVDVKENARARFEDAILSGKSAALLEQDRANLFTQKIGNIPPESEIVCEVTVDQRLNWLLEGCWEWSFPTVVAPRYQGEEGRVRDREKVTVDVSSDPIATRAALSLRISDPLIAGRQPESPSHALLLSSEPGRVLVTFASSGGERLDRDVVVRWPVAKLEVGSQIAVARPAGEGHPGAYGLLTLVPPAPEGGLEPLPRDLIFLIDISGSMGGAPLQRASRVISAMIDSLSDADQLELISFGSRPVRWRKEPVAATREGKREATKWVNGLRAEGATEMFDAVKEALRPLREGAQRQVILVSDGLIGFEREIVAHIRSTLPKGSRFHTIGVGSAPNRALTGPAARAGAGVELILGLTEDVERVAKRMLDRTNAPLVTELEVSGSAVMVTVPAVLPDLFAGAPSLIGLTLRPEGGSVKVQGRMASGRFASEIQAPMLRLGEGNQAIAALYGREQVEDLEMARGSGHLGREVDQSIEKIGLRFQIATARTSWIAVTEHVTVSPQAGRIEETMPHELPHGMAIEALGLRSAAGPVEAKTRMLMSLALDVDEDSEPIGDLEDDAVDPTMTLLGSFTPEQLQQVRHAASPLVSRSGGRAAPLSSGQMGAAAEPQSRGATGYVAGAQPKQSVGQWIVLALALVVIGFALAFLFRSCSELPTPAKSESAQPPAVKVAPKRPAGE